MYRWNTVDKKILLLIGVVIITSGCLEETGLTGGENQEELPNRGLVIEDYSITDNELRPGQQAVIRAEFRNYHREIDIETVELANYGTLLSVERQGCTPEVGELEGARDRVQPLMECTWTVEAPGESELEGFQERSEPVQMRVSYNASMDSEPLNLDFRPVEDVTSTTVASTSASNGEVSVNIAADNPAPLESGTTLEVVANNNGPGRLPNGYSFNFEPRRLFDDCEDGRREQGLQGDEVNFVCSLTTDSEGTTNIFVSTDYKYVKEPTLDITLVNN